MGYNSWIVVTGDIIELYLPPATISVLADAAERLRDVPGVSVIVLDKSDIVRHPLVQAIVNAYEGTEPARETGSGAGRRGDGFVTPDHPPPTGPAASE